MRGEKRVYLYCGFGLAIIEQLRTRVEHAANVNDNIFNQFATHGTTLAQISKVSISLSLSFSLLLQAIETLPLPTLPGQATNNRQTNNKHSINSDIQRMLERDQVTVRNRDGNSTGENKRRKNPRN